MLHATDPIPLTHKRIETRTKVKANACALSTCVVTRMMSVLESPGSVLCDLSHVAVMVEGADAVLLLVMSDGLQCELLRNAQALY